MTSALPLLQLVVVQLVLYAGMWSAVWLVLRNERVPILHWLLSALLNAACLLLIQHRGDWTPGLTYVVANVLGVGGFVAMARGTEIFLCRTPRDAEHLPLMGVLCVGLFLIGSGTEARTPRVLLVCSTLAWVMLRLAVSLWLLGRREFGSRITLFGAAIPGIFGLVYLSRAVMALQEGGSVEIELHHPGPATSAIVYACLVTAALLNFLLLFLVVARLIGNLVHQSQHDPLTGLLNRRAMQLLLNTEWARHRRLGTPFAVISVDVDHFKSINDVHGHAVGDAVLQRVATVLRDHARAADSVARMGGEEFLILMPDIEVVTAVNAAQRLRVALRESDAKPKVTASFGVAFPTANDYGLEAVLQRADAALYGAKRAGRDCVICEAFATDGATSLAPG